MNDSLAEQWHGREEWHWRRPDAAWSFDVSYTFDACGEVLLRWEMRAALLMLNGNNGVWDWGLGR